MSLKSNVFLTAALALLAPPAMAEDAKPLVSGQNEYIWNCADCHGLDGRGKGPLAEALVRPPADLTTIEKRNMGVYPADALYDVIAGRAQVIGHQSFQMPRYWERFKQSEGQPGFDKAEVRIKAIVEYLRTLQKP